jgi:cation diffusion facilitator CzcD-associated flavoprotein CzcO
MAKNGVDVTMLQRSPTFVMTVENGMNLMVAPLYNENTPSVDVADRLAEANPKFVVKLFHQRLIRQLQVADGAVLAGLTAAGFNHWSGPDSSGFIMLALDKAGGYYHSTGGSEMIADGDIKVQQGEIASFEPGSVVKFKDGTTQKYDVVVFATGYTGFPDMVRDTLGEHCAQTFNPVWGLDEEGEIRGVARDSGIPNMYFSVGALAAGRLTSKIIALQIVQDRLGVLGQRYTYAQQLKEGGIATKSAVAANGH